MSVRLRASDVGLPTAEEDALLTTIAASPGVSVRELARSLECRPETVVRLTQRLVDRGVVERRPLMRTRNDGRERSYPGLYATTEPSTAGGAAPCPACQARRDHSADGPECRIVRELLDVGRSTGWPRVSLSAGEYREDAAYHYGRAIYAGQDMWALFIDRAPDLDALQKALQRASAIAVRLVLGEVR